MKLVFYMGSGALTALAGKESWVASKEKGTRFDESAVLCTRTDTSAYECYRACDPSYSQDTEEGYDWLGRNRTAVLPLEI